MFPNCLCAISKEPSDLRSVPRLFGRTPVFVVEFLEKRRIGRIKKSLRKEGMARWFHPRMAIVDMNGSTFVARPFVHGSMPEIGIEYDCGASRGAQTRVTRHIFEILDFGALPIEPVAAWYYTEAGAIVGDVAKVVDA